MSEREGERERGREGGRERRGGEDRERWEKGKGTRKLNTNKLNIIYGQDVG